MRKLLNNLIDAFQKKLPVNRVVALLSAPAAALAGVSAAWLAQHFPGLPVFTAAQLVPVELGVAGAVVAAAYKWLDGWQKHEAEHPSHYAPNTEKSE